MKLSLSILILSLVSFFLTCQKTETQPAEELSIIFTGNMNNDRSDADGFSRRISQIYQLQLAGDNSLVFITGGILLRREMQSTSNKLITNTEAELLSRIYDELNITAVNIGEDDLQLEEGSLSSLKDSANFKFLSSNIYNRTTRRLLFIPFMVKTVGSIKVGVFGLSRDTGDYPSSYEIREPFKAWKQMIKILSKEADVIVALSNLPFEVDSALADSLRGIDFILGSYGKSRPIGPQIVGRTPIYNSGGDGTGIARIDISIREKNFMLADITTQNSSLHELQQRISEYEELKKNNRGTDSIKDLKSKQREIKDSIIVLPNTVSFSIAGPPDGVPPSEKIDSLMNELVNLYSKNE